MVFIYIFHHHKDNLFGPEPIMIPLPQTIFTFPLPHFGTFSFPKLFVYSLGVVFKSSSSLGAHIYPGIKS